MKEAYFVKIRIVMNKFWTIICSVLLVACGGEDGTKVVDGDITPPVQNQTIEQLKQDAIEFTDEESGVTFSQIEIDSSENIVVQMNDGAEFSLVSDGDTADKLVVKGLLTIK